MMRTRIVAMAFAWSFIFAVWTGANGHAAAAGGDPLSDRALSNLRALALLYGDLRYFHPSSELSDAGLTAIGDWSGFLTHAITKVEHANDANQLAATLQELVKPLAPTVLIHAGPAPHDAPRRVAAPEHSNPTHGVFWRHIGHGRTDGNYRSTRTIVPLADLAAQTVEPQAGEVIVRDLGGGVWSQTPMCLWVEDNRTIPAAAAAYHAPAQAAGDVRTLRLAASMIAWNIFQHFYPYFDVVKNDWDGSLEALLRDSATATSDAAYGKALQRLVAKLHDGHGVVLHPSLPRTHTLPLALAFVEGKLVVSAVADSLKQQVQPGDIVTGYERQPIAQVLDELTRHTSTSTPQHMRFRLTQELIMGGQGEVDLELLRGDGTQVTVTIKRIERDSARSVEAWREPRPGRIIEIEDGICYVNLDVITRAEFSEALPELVKAKGIVFDLRGYPREIFIVPIHHHIDEASRSANWRMPIVLYPDRKKMEYQKSFWPVPPAEPRLPKNIVYITDGRAVSAAETYLAIAREVGAAIVGEATAGTNGNVNPVDLPGGYRIVWTGMRVLKHDETEHHGVGILPTHPVQRTIEGVRAGRDEYLDAALGEIAP